VGQDHQHMKGRGLTATECAVISHGLQSYLFLDSLLILGSLAAVGTQFVMLAESQVLKSAVPAEYVSPTADHA
jgi:hypothetical protein